MKAELRGATATSLPNSNLFQYSPPPSLGGLRAGGGCGSILGGGTGTLDASCIEKLLHHCAAALESNDTTLAQQVMWVLNNVAAANGDPNQRLTSWFLKALVARAARLCPNTTVPFAAEATAKLNRTVRPMSVTELAGYIDLTPWHRFGFTASNGAILRAIQGRSKIHIIDFGIMHCMQWPTLIDALSKRPEGPPLQLRITVPAARPPVPPILTVSTETIGFRLANFARSRNLPFQLHVAKTSNSLGDQYCSNHNPNNLAQELQAGLLNPTTLDIRNDEAVVVNCQSWLRYLPSDDSINQYLSTKDGFLDSIRSLNPHVVTVTDEDCDLDSPSLTSRILACFNYLWIPFDALETFLPKDSPQRAEYEADVGKKIENIIGLEGEQRIERPESGARVSQRMRRAGFAGAAFGEETVREVKGILDEHASGWGMKRDEEMLVLTWKGHSSVFTEAWIPSQTQTQSQSQLDQQLMNE